MHVATTKIINELQLQDCYWLAKAVSVKVFIKLRSKHNKLEGIVCHCAYESKRIDQYKYENMGFQELCW